MTVVSNAVKKRARKAVELARQRGELVPQPCQICGSHTQIEAHHSDYTRPLDVTWLCRPHHRELHDTPRFVVIDGRIAKAVVVPPPRPKDAPRSPVLWRRIEAYLADHGPASMERIAVGIDAPYDSVRKAVYRDLRRFMRLPRRVIGLAGQSAGQAAGQLVWSGVLSCSENLDSANQQNSHELAEMGRRTACMQDKTQDILKSCPVCG